MGISWTLVKRCTKAHTNQPEITVKFTGYDLAKLEECWIVAVNRFFSPGGGAEQVGNIASYPHIPVNRLLDHAGECRCLNIFANKPFTEIWANCNG